MMIVVQHFDFPLPPLTAQARSPWMQQGSLFCEFFLLFVPRVAIEDSFSTKIVLTVQIRQTGMLVSIFF